MIGHEFSKLDPQQPHTQCRSSGVNAVLHFFWNLPRLALPLEGQKALFIRVLSVVEETFMETPEVERLKPSSAQRQTEAAECAFWLLVSAPGLTGACSPTGQLPEPS